MRIPGAFSLVHSLNWRSALKSFAPIAPELVQLQPILEAARLAPSSFGLQPYNIHVVVNKDVKSELRKVSFDQPQALIVHTFFKFCLYFVLCTFVPPLQVTECSHLLVFAARSDVEGTIERFIKSAEVGKSAPDYAASLRKCFVSTLDSKDFLSWSTNQAYIALGLAVAAAADSRIGSCPMTGFEPEGVNKVLGLPSNEHAVAYLAVGSHLDTEPDGGRVKLRLKIDDLVEYHR